jgi:hypothetical protein
MIKKSCGPFHNEFCTWFRGLAKVNFAYYISWSVDFCSGFENNFVVLYL